MTPDAKPGRGKSASRSRKPATPPLPIAEGAVIQFVLNGSVVTIANPDPTARLIDYLRSPEAQCTGTKLGCGEGGCGACTVVIGWEDLDSGDVVRPVNACLRPLIAMDGMVAWTPEGIGTSEPPTQLDPVQFMVAACNGSQCGFCTPGFVMNMWGLLQENPKPDAQTVEDRFAGNLCRCTGYRPILYAMRTFAHDSDKREGSVTPFVLESGEQLRKRHKAAKPLHERTHFGVRASQLAPKPVTARTPSPTSPPRTKSREFRATGSGYEWIRPGSLADVYGLKARFGGDPQKIRLVVGDTSRGIYKEDVEDPHVFVDVSHFRELHGMSVTSAGITAGASVTLTSFMEFLDAVIAKGPASQVTGIAALRRHMNRISGFQVRNVGCLAGNLMLTRNHVAMGDPFPSDLFVVLVGLGASITIGSAQWPPAGKTMAIESFPVASLPVDFVVLSISIPFTGADDFVETYKVARREQNAHALVNAAFAVTITKGGVTGARLALGNIARYPIRATKTEAMLATLPWTEATLAAALPVLQAEIAALCVDLPGDGVLKEYREALALSLFYKFFIAVALKVAPSEVEPAKQGAGIPYVRPISSGQQDYEVYPDEFPISEPIVKSTAFAQASGVAVYTDDVPSPPRTVYGAIVYGACAHANFTFDKMAANLDATIAALAGQFPNEFLDFLTVRDLPNTAVNATGIAGDDTVFADGEVTCAGDIIGLVVAATDAGARRIARVIQAQAINYVDLPAVTDFGVAISQGDFFKDDPAINGWLEHLRRIERPGSDDTWLDDPTKIPTGAAVVTGWQGSEAQAQFYMEPQTTLAIPGPYGDMTLYCATQDPATVQKMVAAVLGQPANSIAIQTSLVGGGFGGKTTRVPFIAMPAAIAARKLRRPVRIVLDRNTDMMVIGKRHPYRGQYYLLYAPDGTILGSKRQVFLDGGCSVDCSFFVSDEASLNGDGAYMIPTYRMESNICKTNYPSNNAMRSFGVIQQSLVMEEGIEQAAFLLGMLPEDIRRKNLYKTATDTAWDSTPYGEELRYCNLAHVWDVLETSSDFRARVNDVAAFNAANRWRKRGISMVPMKYGVSYSASSLDYASAMVTAYTADGSVLVQHGGVEMGQGIHTKMLQIAARDLNIPIEKARVALTNTDVIANASSTGASTGSDLNGGAVSAAATQLRTELQNFLDGVRKAQGDQYCKDQGIDYWNYPDGWQTHVPVRGQDTLMWNNVVTAASMARVNLAAQAFYQTPGLVDVTNKNSIGHPYFYYTYSAAVSEVEIDVLTGETTILRSDLLYDAGHSLNPALDVGQVEGGFIQGVGMVTTEQLIYDEGVLTSNGTWNYKPPCSKSIPVDFRVTLLKSDPTRHLARDGTPIDPAAVHSSKATGEPPTVLANTVFFAIKHAILAARKDAGDGSWFAMDAPATVERVRQACLTTPSMLTT